MTAVKFAMKISAETSPLVTSMLQEVENWLADVSLLKVFEEPLRQFLSLPETSEQFIAVDVIGYATGACNLLVALNPGQSFFRLHAALRTRNPDFLGIVKDAHVKAPQWVGVDLALQPDHNNQLRAPSTQGEPT